MQYVGSINAHDTSFPAVGVALLPNYNARSTGGYSTYSFLVLNDHYNSPLSSFGDRTRFLVGVTYFINNSLNGLSRYIAEFQSDPFVCGLD